MSGNQERTAPPCGACPTPPPQTDRVPAPGPAHGPRPQAAAGSAHTVAPACGGASRPRLSTDTVMAPRPAPRVFPSRQVLYWRSAHSHVTLDTVWGPRKNARGPWPPEGPLYSHVSQGAAQGWPCPRRGGPGAASVLCPTWLRLSRVPTTSGRSRHVSLRAGGTASRGPLSSPNKCSSVRGRESGARLLRAPEKVVGGAGDLLGPPSPGGSGTAASRPSALPRERRRTDHFQSAPRGFCFTKNGFGCPSCGLSLSQPRPPNGSVAEAGHSCRRRHAHAARPGA